MSVAPLPSMTPKNRQIPFLVKGPSYAGGLPGDVEIAGFRGEICDAGAQAFFGYWASKCDADSLPEWARIDPIEIPKLLSAMFIEEWDEATQQSCIRLAGVAKRFTRSPPPVRWIKAIS